LPWRGPEYPGELPTLGYDALDWTSRYLIVPDGPAAGEPLRLYDEQALFLLRYYTIDPDFDGPIIRGKTLRNARRIRRAVLSRSKGWGKSPVMAALCLLEALGDVVFDGWDAYGEPVGRPWNSLGFKPKVQLLAMSEDQTANTWDPLLEMARNGGLHEDYDIEPMETFVNVPRGRIEYATSSSSSREGFRPVFAVLDQTESWIPSVGGPRLAATVRRNLAKVQGSSIETPNAFRPGEGSVAERSWNAWQLQQEGRLKGQDGILFDHREAPAATDITDRESLKAGLTVAYGDSADVAGGHVNLDRIIEDFWDPDTDPQDARLFYLNQITHRADSWVSGPEWAAVKDPEKGNHDTIDRADAVTVGFDGSRARARGVTDATALVGCRVSDGHLFEIRVWEQPPNAKDWRVPVDEVLAEVDRVFDRYNVVGFYADPAKWESHVAAWEAKYGPTLKVKATRQHPIEWWMTGGRSGLVVAALQRFHDAMLDQEMSHDGASALTRHVLNAYRKPSRSGIQIGKDHPESDRKIDAAVAAVLAWQARLDALAAGVGKREAVVVPRRLR
jgi:hypothetical protein